MHSAEIRKISLKIIAQNEKSKKQILYRNLNLDLYLLSDDYMGHENAKKKTLNNENEKRILLNPKYVLPIYLE